MRSGAAHIKLEILPRRYPVAGTFRISRSAVTHVDVVEVRLSSGGHLGRGECRPYPRYGDSVASVTAELEALRERIESGDVAGAIDALPAGPAKNALDCAYLDLTARRSGQPVWAAFDLPAPGPRETAFTLSWDAPDVMAIVAREAEKHTLLKLKIGASGLDRVAAVAKARPDARLILDANEALDAPQLAEALESLATHNIALIEQPLPADHTSPLPPSPIPICADEGLHTQADLPRLKALGYRAVNVKLDKCGGLSAGVELMREAKAMGFTVMGGCMVSSSLAMAPMMVAESLIDIVDLDGALLLARDIENGLVYEGAKVSPPSPELWGSA